MASITKTATGYRARYRDPAGKSREKAFERKRDAEAFLTQVEHTKRAGSYVDQQAGRQTFGDYAKAWMAVQVWRPSTAAQVRTNMERHVLPVLEHRPLASIAPSEMQALVKALSATLAPATVELVARYVASVFKAAVRDRVIARSPFDGVKLPKVEVRQVVPVTVEQVRALELALPDRYRALVTLAAGTGMRQGECFGLTVDRADFLRRTVRVDRQLITGPGGVTTFGPTKTRASARTIPVPDVVLAALAEHLRVFGAGPEGLVFTNDDGEAIRRTRFSDVWRPAARVAGLELGQGMHALRHFYASLLIRAGCSVKVVQARLGHATAAETLDTYSHLWPDDEDRTRQAVDDVFAMNAADPVGSSWGQPAGG
jgi:integrase